MADYLKLADVARRLGVSEKTARRYVKAGAFPSVFVGNAYRVREEDLEAFLESAKVEPGKVPAPPSLEPSFNDVLLEEERRDREEQLATGLPHLMYVWAEYGKRLEQDIHTTPGTSAAMRAHDFYTGEVALKIIYEELSNARQPSRELQEAKEQLDVIGERLGTLYRVIDPRIDPRGRTVSEKDYEEMRAYEEMRERRGKKLGDREATDAEDAQAQ